MSWRFYVFLSLVVATLGYRALIVHQVFLDEDITTGTGMRVSIIHEYGLIRVEAVDAQLPSGEPSAAARGGVQPGDVIATIVDHRGHARAINSFFDYGAALGAIPPDEPWGLVVERGPLAGPRERAALDMPAVPAESWSMQATVLRLGIQVWLPLLFITAGAFLGFARPRDEDALIAAMMFLCFSSTFYENLFALPSFAQEAALFHWVTCLHLTPYLFFRFFLVFPSRSIIDRRLPFLRYALLGLTALTWAINLALNFEQHASIRALLPLRRFVETDPGSLLEERLTILVMGSAVLLGLVALARHLVDETTSARTRRLWILLFGAGVGLSPFVVLALLQHFHYTPGLWFWVLMALLAGFFPLSFVYVVIRDQVFGIRLIIRRSLQYAFLSRGVLLVEALVAFSAIFFFAGPMLEQVLPAAGGSVVALLSACVAMVLMVAFRQLNRTLLPIIDRLFFREQYNARRMLIDLSRTVRQLGARPEHLLEAVADKVRQSLHPEGASVYLRAGAWPFDCAAARVPESVFAEGDEERRSRYVLCVQRRPERELFALGAGTEVAREEEAPFVDVAPRGFFEVFRDEEPRAIDLGERSERGLALGARSELVGGAALAATRADLAPLAREEGVRLVVPLVSGGDVLGFLALGAKRSEEPYSREDRELLLSVAEQVGIALDNARLIGRAAEQERLKHELDIARDVQRALMPKAAPPLRTLSYNGTCRPALGIGGDYFDFIELGDERLAIALGDVAGKGISAALLMSGLQAALRSHAARGAADLATTMLEINRLLCRSMEENRFATFFLATYDDSTRELRYVNAGHNPPILVRGEAGEGAPGGTLRLGPDNVVLGLMEETDFIERSLPLETGDVLVVFSDGVTEATDGEDEDFGDERLAELVRRHRHLPPDALRDLILEEVAVFAGDAPQHDDMTLIVAQVLEPGRERAAAGASASEPLASLELSGLDAFEQRIAEEDEQAGAPRER